MLVELNDGTTLEEVEIEYPVGHKRRVRLFPTALDPVSILTDSDFSALRAHPCCSTSSRSEWLKFGVGP
jgi:hypothetical protein